MIHLSASAIRTFKHCTLEFYYKYILGIRKIEEPEALRMGSNWHNLLEIINIGPKGPCPRCRDDEILDCPLCNGTGKLPDDIKDAIIAELNSAYLNRPMNIEIEKWETEREVLLQSIFAYMNLYGNEDAIATEVPFKLPLLKPNGRPVAGTILVGKLDRINGKRQLVESKSTSMSLDGDSQFWESLNLDTQTLLYLSTVQRMQKENKLAALGITSDQPLINETVYDVWRKPRIRPKKLTQKASKEFVENGVYYGKKFDIPGQDVYLSGEWPPKTLLCVGDKNAEVTPGKKEGTFAIRETPRMFGARLADELINNTDEYFIRKPLPRTEADIREFELELHKIHKTIKAMKKDNLWFRNENQCKSFGKCNYINHCYNNVRLYKENMPDGFEVIF